MQKERVAKYAKKSIESVGATISRPRAVNVYSVVT